MRRVFCDAGFLDQDRAAKTTSLDVLVRNRPVAAITLLSFMTKTIDNIVWRMPWRPLNHSRDFPGLQLQLERELAEGHSLWGRDAEVVGRRVDNDDVLVLCSDGTMAAVHLDWATGPHKKPAEYPSVITYQSLAELQPVIDSDANAYSDDD